MSNNFKQLCMESFDRWKVVLFLSLLALAVFACFYPGSTGVYLLDDYHVLFAIGNLGVIDSLDKLKQYIFGGVTGPGGRPFSLFTFVLNTREWPAEPYGFLVTNIAIHVLNVALVGWFLIHLLNGGSKKSGQNLYIAGATCALWALHPIHVSSVLYIVQRMALLSTLFSWIVLIAYLYVRDCLIRQQYSRAIVISILGCVAAAMAFLSKENAVLLPLQIVIIELFLVYSGRVNNKIIKRLFWLLIVPATALVIGYLLRILVLYSWDFMQTGVAKSFTRNFTLYERLYTELRVLGDYLLAILIPRAQSPGVFFDSYTISKGLLSPISTLFWLCAHLCIISAAIVLRRRAPLILLGVAWFYISHLLESSVLMLELRFDHRNYMASLGICLLIGVAINFIKNKNHKLIVSGMVILLYSAMLVMSARLWGSPLQAALVWAAENSTSERANFHAAEMLLRYTDSQQKGLEYLQRAVEVSPRPTNELKYISRACATYNGKSVDWFDIAERMKREARDWSLYGVLLQLREMKAKQGCDLLTFEGYRALLAAYRQNPFYQNDITSIKLDTEEILAAFQFNQPDTAVNVEMGRNQVSIPLPFAMERAGIFATNGYLDLAIERLDIAIQIAEQLGHDDAYIIQNAKEILNLIIAERQKNGSSKKVSDEQK